MALFMDGPPFVEGFIRSNIESLFWWWCLSECVGNIGAVDEHVFASGHCVEKSGAGLIDAVSISLIEHLDVTGSGGAVTDASSFLATVGGLDCVCPDKMEDCVVGVGLHRCAEHALIIILIEL